MESLDKDIAKYLNLLTDTKDEEINEYIHLGIEELKEEMQPE